jgi:hypothetical protein
VLPSLSPLYVAGLGRLMPFEYTQLVLLMIGAGLLIAGALRGPETAAVEMTELDGAVHAASPHLPTQRGSSAAEVTSPRPARVHGLEPGDPPGARR